MAQSRAAIALDMAILRAQLVQSQALEISILSGSLGTVDGRQAREISELLEEIANCYRNIAEHVEAEANKSLDSRAVLQAEA